jgi:hypothetical protein
VAAVTGPGGAAIDARPWLGGVDLTLRDAGARWPALVRGRLSRIAVEGHFGTDQPWERVAYLDSDSV